MWSDVSTPPPPTPLSENLGPQGYPSILLGFPNDSRVTIRTPGAPFSKVPVTFRARNYKLKAKSIKRWRSF